MYPGIQAEICILAEGFDAYPGKGHSVQIGNIYIYIYMYIYISKPGPAPGLGPGPGPGLPGGGGAPPLGWAGDLLVIATHL